MINFQGTSAKELKKAFKDSVDDYLEFCEELGEKPEKPYSGKFVLRLPEEIHRLASISAQMSGKSLNAWTLDKIYEAVKNEMPEFSTGC